MPASLQLDSQPPRALTAERYVIGRSSGCDIALPGADTSISRRHALLQCEGENEWTLKDLSSHNGTRVNSQRITGATSLKHGDRIQIGDSSLLFTLDAAGLRDGETITFQQEHLEDVSAERPAARQASPEVMDRPLAPHTQEKPVAPAHKRGGMGVFGAGLLAASLCTYLLIVRPIVEEYNKPIGVAARSAGSIAEMLDKALPQSPQPIHDIIATGRQEGDKHTTRYNAALAAQQVCLAIGLLGAAMLGYSVLTTKR